MIRRILERLRRDRPEPESAPAPLRERTPHTVRVDELVPRLGQLTVVDIRHPRDWAMGLVPGARRHPGGAGLAGGSLSGTSFVLVDQINAEAPDLCEALRKQGLDALWLEGGFVAWLEEAAPLEALPQHPGSRQIGDRIRTADQEGWIVDLRIVAGKVHLGVWLEPGTILEWDEDALVD